MTKKMHEFIVEVENTGEKTSVFYTGDCTLWYVEKSEYEEGNLIDIEATLSLYFDPKIIAEWIDYIENDGEIYDTLSIKELVNNYKLYNILSEKYGMERGKK